MLSLFKRKKKIELVKRTTPEGVVFYSVEINGIPSIASMSMDVETTKKYYEAFIKSNGRNADEHIVISSCDI